MNYEDTNVKYKEVFKKQIACLTSKPLFLGILLSIVGGFLDAYTFIGRGGVFANAQTGNIVLLGIDIFEKDWGQAILHTIPIFAFIIGVIIAEVIKKNSFFVFKLNKERGVLIIEILVLFLIGFIPYSIPNAFVNIPIAFIASLQYCSFNRVLNYPYATTMCTGNLRVASIAAYNAVTRKDEKSAVEAISYFSIIFSFLIGAILGALLVPLVGTYAVWFTMILLVVCIFLIKK